MRIAIVMFAKDEAERIESCLESLALQTVFSPGYSEICTIVVPNGCSDNTAFLAQSKSSLFTSYEHNSYLVDDLVIGGKARSWNYIVHNKIPREAGVVVFVDADIIFANNDVIRCMIEELQNDSYLYAISGTPSKDIIKKTNKNFLDIFSIYASKYSGYSDCISGSLYAVRNEILQQIWIPDQTPGEDGFLNAMLTTDGFSSQYNESRVRQLRFPTHYYEASNIRSFFSHEKRMFVGTVINISLFEYFWSLNLKSNSGQAVADLNRTNPGWVDEIVAKRGSFFGWRVPISVILRRLESRSDEALWRKISRLPLRLAVTLATLPSAIAANKVLRQRGAGSFW